MGSRSENFLKLSTAGEKATRRDKPDMEGTEGNDGRKEMTSDLRILTQNGPESKWSNGGDG